MPSPPALLPLLFVPLFLAACAEPTRTLPQVGLANPASVYCVQQGGRVEIRRDQTGETGYCRLPNGKLVEEQAFFGAGQAVEAF
jgi:hypothetical protein